MATNDKKQKRQENIISSLNALISALGVVEKATTGIPPVTVAVTTVKEFLVLLKVGFPLSCVDCELKRRQESKVNKGDYADLGLICTQVCTALSRGLNGKELSELSISVCEAIKDLTT